MVPFVPPDCLVLLLFLHSGLPGWAVLPGWACVCGGAQHCSLHSQARFAFNMFKFRLFSWVPDNIFFSFPVQNLLTSSILKMPVSEEDGSFHKTFAMPRNRPLASPLQVTKNTLICIYINVLYECVYVYIPNAFWQTDFRLLDKGECSGEHGWGLRHACGCKEMVLRAVLGCWAWQSLSRGVLHLSRLRCCRGGIVPGWLSHHANHYSPKRFPGTVRELTWAGGSFLQTCWTRLCCFGEQEGLIVGRWPELVSQPGAGGGTPAALVCRFGAAGAPCALAPAAHRRCRRLLNAPCTSWGLWAELNVRHLMRDRCQAGFGAGRLLPSVSSCIHLLCFWINKSLLYRAWSKAHQSH